MGNATHAGIRHVCDGVEYEFSPLELEDLEWLEMWLKARVIEAGNAAANSIPNEAQGDRILRMAASEAAGIDIFGGDFLKLLNPAGVTRILYRMVIRNHPEVTLEMCRNWISDAKKAKALLSKLELLRANVMGKEASTKETPLSRRAKSRRNSTEQKSPKS